MEAKPLWRSSEIRERARAYAQQLNPNSSFDGATLSRMAGLKRAHVSIARIAPGKDSFAYHAHSLEEEWAYVLSGSGVALIDGVEHPVVAGDFMGFPPGVPHLLMNRSTDELVYLMGGEDHPLDVLEYPALGKRYLLEASPTGTRFYELSEATRPFGPAPAK